MIVEPPLLADSEIAAKSPPFNEPMSLNASSISPGEKMISIRAVLS